MDPHIAAWFSLLGFVLPLGTATYLFTGKRTKRQWQIRLAAFLLFIGLLAALSMILQGVHLWHQGWEGIDINPNTAGRIASKGRGKGGIIILAIRYLPQFLVFGYGFIIWEVKDFLSYRFWRKHILPIKDE